MISVLKRGERRNGGPKKWVTRRASRTAGLKNEDKRGGLINSGSQDVTVDGCDCPEGGDAKVVAEDECAVTGDF